MQEYPENSLITHTYILDNICHLDLQSNFERFFCISPKMAAQQIFFHSHNAPVLNKSQLCRQLTFVGYVFFRTRHPRRLLK